VNDVTCGCVDTGCPSVECVQNCGSFPYQHPHFTTSKICTSAFYPWPCTCHPASSLSNQHYTILITELTFSGSNCTVLYSFIKQADRTGCSPFSHHSHPNSNSNLNSNPNPNPSYSHVVRKWTSPTERNLRADCTMPRLHACHVTLRFHAT